jgi:predicted solute-binding protein
VRRSLPERDKLRLGISIRSALELALADLEDVARAQHERTGLPAEEILAYLGAIRFALGPEELAGAQAFEMKLADL